MIAPPTMPESGDAGQGLRNNFAETPRVATVTDTIGATWEELVGASAEDLDNSDRSGTSDTPNITSPNEIREESWRQLEEYAAQKRAALAAAAGDREAEGQLIKELAQVYYENPILTYDLEDLHATMLDINDGDADDTQEMYQEYVQWSLEPSFIPVETSPQNLSGRFQQNPAKADDRLRSIRPSMIDIPDAVRAEMQALRKAELENMSLGEFDPSLLEPLPATDSQIRKQIADALAYEGDGEGLSKEERDLQNAVRARIAEIEQGIRAEVEAETMGRLQEEGWLSPDDKQSLLLRVGALMATHHEEAMNLIQTIQDVTAVTVDQLTEEVKALQVAVNERDQIIEQTHQRELVLTYQNADLRWQMQGGTPLPTEDQERVSSEQTTEPAEPAATPEVVEAPAETAELTPPAAIVSAAAEEVAQEAAPTEQVETAGIDASLAKTVPAALQETNGSEIGISVFIDPAQLSFEELLKANGSHSYDWDRSLSADEVMQKARGETKEAVVRELWSTHNAERIQQLESELATVDAIGEAALGSTPETANLARAAELRRAALEVRKSSETEADSVKAYAIEAALRMAEGLEATKALKTVFVPFRLMPRSAMPVSRAVELMEEYAAATTDQNLILILRDAQAKLEPYLDEIIRDATPKTAEVIQAEEKPETPRAAEPSRPPAVADTSEIADVPEVVTESVIQTLGVSEFIAPSQILIENSLIESGIAPYNWQLSFESDAQAAILKRDLPAVRAEFLRHNQNRITQGESELAALTKLEQDPTTDDDVKRLVQLRRSALEIRKTFAIDQATEQAPELNYEIEVALRIAEGLEPTRAIQSVFAPFTKLPKRVVGVTRVVDLLREAEAIAGENEDFLAILQNAANLLQPYSEMTISEASPEP